MLDSSRAPIGPASRPRRLSSISPRQLLSHRPVPAGISPEPYPDDAVIAQAVPSLSTTDVCTVDADVQRLSNCPLRADSISSVASDCMSNVRSMRRLRKSRQACWALMSCRRLSRVQRRVAIVEQAINIAVKTAPPTAGGGFVAICHPPTVAISGVRSCGR